MLGVGRSNVRVSFAAERTTFTNPGCISRKLFSIINALGACKQQGSWVVRSGWQPPVRAQAICFAGEGLSSAQHDAGFRKALLT